MRKYKPCDITDRDYKLLRFLWKWKVVSTHAIARKFFPEAEAFTAYKRLNILKAAGYVDTVVISIRFNEAWVIKEKGFNFIQPHLGPLASKGYKSANYVHDFYSSAFHLGEWLIYQPTTSQTFSEQQLRCLSEEAWPKWIPRSTTHRPDGYSIYETNNTRIILAFETEISLKTFKRYESVSIFYDSQTTINLVLWMVDSSKTVQNIKSNFEKFQNRSIGKHQFILLDDFKKNGWNAKIIEGQFKGKTIDGLMIYQPHSRPTRDPVSRVTLDLLNTRKRPIHSAPYKTSKNS